MLRTFELRLKPKAAQRSELAHILADSCETYNAALQERRDAWNLCRKQISYYDQQAELTELRKDAQFAAIAVSHKECWRIRRAGQCCFSVQIRK